jgi:carbon monoxide dehydrogenase subunit G
MELTFIIKKAPTLVFNYLTDMQKFASVHPVINKIEETGSNTYLVYETLKFGFIPISFTYPVSIEVNRLEQLVVYRAEVMKIAQIEMRFMVNPKDGHTQVVENIIFKSLLPIKPMMQIIFKKQHSQLFKNIENLL